MLLKLPERCFEAGISLHVSVLVDAVAKIRSTDADDTIRFLLCLMFESLSMFVFNN